MFSMDPNSAVATPANGAIASTTVSYTQNLNTSFVYDGVTAYNKTTVTTTGSAPETDTLGFTLALPTAFRVQPTGWPFGFMAGATPQASFSWKKTTTSGQKVTTQVDNITGSTVNTTTITFTQAVATSSVALSTSFGEAHFLGIFFPFQNGMRADLRLNGNNLLAFDTLTLQFYAPLK